MITGVFVEPWKQDIFVAELKADGFEVETLPPIEIAGQPVVQIQVKTESDAKLQPTLERAQAACRRRKKH